MSEPVLQVEGLTISFGQGRHKTKAVDQLSYVLGKGETLAIVGESGSGKSVSSLALLGLLPAGQAHIESGRAIFEGRDLLALDEASMRRLRGDRLTMIFQEPMTSLNPVLRIGLQLTEGLVAHQGMSQSEADRRAIEMLQLVQLPEPESTMRRFPHELSGGMRQRVMIAMAMASNPAILLADEPTTALDVTVQAQILDLMRSLKARFGASIILITHDMGVVAEMADRVIVMNRGCKVEEGPVAQIFKQPANDYTKKLLAAVPRLGSQAGNIGPKAVINEPKQPTSEIVVDAKGLTKRFGRAAWFGPDRSTLAMDDVGFTLHAGETLAIVGESGSGKSTTGRAILRLIEVDRGELSVGGENVRRMGKNAVRSARRHMQMIFQDPFASLNPRMNVGQLVMEPMIIHRMAKGLELEQRCAALFEKVGLEADHMRRFPHEFSGGQRQRVAIARALGTEPALIVADEPTSALDVSVQAQVLELMLALQQSTGLAYLFISHDMAVVEEMSHRVAVMHQGRIVEMGSRANVLNAPQHPYTKALLAAVPIADPTRRRGALPKLDLSTLPRGPLIETHAGHWVAA